MPLLSECVAVISGAGIGLGRDAGLAFAQEGAVCVLVSRMGTAAREPAAEIRAERGRAEVFDADVLQPDHCACVAEAVWGRYGRIDVLVNVAYHHSVEVPLLDPSPDLKEWRPIFETNFFGTLQMTRAIALRMVNPARGGSIIMVNSMASERTRVGLGSYTASKAALKKVTRTLALELAQYRIRVNSLHPGYVWGDWMAGVMQREIRLGYIPHTHEYAGTLLYLASDLARPTTDQAIHVNGGQFFH